MAKTISWGIIGCGNVTEVKSGPAFNKIPGSKLTAVMRRNAEKAKDYAHRHKVPKWYSDAGKLIHDPDINAIYVATPPAFHAEYAIAAMRAGKPVYVEKPMAVSYAQCAEMIKVSEETGVPLFVAYYRRRLPGFVKIKELIDDNMIGKPLFFDLRFFQPPYPDDYSKPLPWRVIPDISGGGYLYDLGSHQLDILEYLTGPLEVTSKTTLNRQKLYPPEDYVSASFQGEHGITGQGVWWFTAPSHAREDTIKITGERGSIIFSCFGFTHTKLIVDGKVQYIKNFRPGHVQKNLIKSIVEELRGEGKCPATAYSAALTNKLLENIADDKTLMTHTINDK